MLVNVVRARNRAKKILSQKNWPKSVGVVIFGLCLFMFFFEFLDGFYLREIEIFNSEIVDRFVAKFVLIFLKFNFKCLFLSFLFSPLICGILRFFCKFSMKKFPDMDEIFYFFKNFQRIISSLVANFVFSVATFLNLNLCFFLGFLFLNDFLIFKRSKDFEVLFISIVFFILGVIFFLVLNFKFFFAIFDYSLNNKNIFLSLIRIKIRKFSDRFLFLKLFGIFFPDFLFCFFVLPVLYVIPLFLVTVSTCVDEFSKDL
jgi:hypothetical protein